MNTAIVICESHTDAVNVVTKLKANNYNEKRISIIGKADQAEEAVAMKDNKLMNVAGTEAGIGAVLGSALGILTGVGIFAIPGFGFIYGAGALVGAIAGFDFGLIGGGIVSALTLTGIEVAEKEKYDHLIKEGHFLVILQGHKDELHKAEELFKDVEGVKEVHIH